ncbi:MAG: hypothetical protein WAS07_13735 [Micropruina sp.]
MTLTLSLAPRPATLVLGLSQVRLGTAVPSALVAVREARAPLPSPSLSPDAGGSVASFRAGTRLVA